MKGFSFIFILFLKVSVTARKDVPNFSPPITNDSIYENDPNFKDWILNKLMNAETACYKAEKFRKLNVIFLFPILGYLIFYAKKMFSFNYKNKLLFL